jgi:hypothetical protein
MVGMLQILTYMVAFLIVLKGIEILQIGLSSTRTPRRALLILGGTTLAACLVAALGFVAAQDRQACLVGGACPEKSVTDSGDRRGDRNDDWERGRDARMKGWAWAESRRLASAAACAELDDGEERTGCEAWVRTFGNKQ